MNAKSDESDLFSLFDKFCMQKYLNCGFKSFVEIWGKGGQKKQIYVCKGTCLTSWFNIIREFANIVYWNLVMHSMSEEKEKYEKKKE